MRSNRSSGLLARPVTTSGIAKQGKSVQVWGSGRATSISMLTPLALALPKAQILDFPLLANGLASGQQKRTMALPPYMERTPIQSATGGLWATGQPPLQKRRDPGSGLGETLSNVPLSGGGHGPMRLEGPGHTVTPLFNQKEGFRLGPAGDPGSRLCA
jgi:hypothetical protein